MIPGTANFGGLPAAQRNAIVMALMAQAQGGAPAGPAFTPSSPLIMGEGGAPEPFTEQALPADPADYSSGFEQAGSTLLGDLGGLSPSAFANSVDSQVVGNALASPGYGSSLGLAHAANVADQAMTALGIYDAIDTSHDVNAAVEEGGYTSPSPAPAPAYESPDPNSPIVGLPSDFTTAQASLSDTGADMGGAAIAADVAGLTGLNAGVNDAVAGYASDQGLSGFDAGPSGAPAGLVAGAAVGYDAGGNTAAGFDAGGNGEGGGGGGGGGGAGK